MAFLAKIKERIRKEMFLPSCLGVIVNPFYIIRNGLYKEIKHFSPLMQGRILDFGCGSKPYEELFVNAEQYIGVDIKVSGHDHVASKVDFFYDGKTLPFDSSYFDGLVSFETLEHVFEPDSIFSELNRVLKSGGKLMLSVPFVWDEHETPYDFARYTSFGMLHLLSKHGFEVLEYEKTTTYFLTICQMFIAYLYQHVLPKNKWLKQLSQLVFIFPLTVLALGLNMIFPRRYDFFCNSVIVARKN
ncbi:class I SAM-dependent methyltransferase [Herbaspirillum lusitanum]|uniref:class I SAM-dependent methyltransferase n=1 Tax=Herbaspirillum lusitanum TaxID=213312 RepID=UPI00036F4FF8|nr:class I SAM-dependent methyltransferase [Herbaspirillum lusitanum]